MKPIEQIPIKESKAELESLYKTSSPFLRPRIEMLIILIKEPVITKPELARRLDVAYNSITKWHELYKQTGINGLLEVKRGKYRHGRDTGFSPEIYQAIEQRHALQPFQSYVELHKWVRSKYLPTIKYSTLIKYLDMHFDGSLKIMKIIELPVKESLPELSRLHEKSLPRMKPRVEMLMALKKNSRISRAELADKLHVSYGSIIKWTSIYNKGGIEKLLEYKLKLVITPKVYAFIEKQFIDNKFKSFSLLYEKVTREYLPGIKYYTLHRYVHRHFASELENAKAMHFPIKEQAKELELLYKKSSNNRKPRIKMLQAIKENPALTKFELADICEVAVGSIHRWCKLYRNGGLNNMLEIKMRGRKRFEMPIGTHEAIGKKLREEPEMSIIELYNWVKSQAVPAMSYNKLYRYIRRNFDIPMSNGSFRYQASESSLLNRVA